MFMAILLAMLRRGGQSPKLGIWRPLVLGIATAAVVMDAAAYCSDGFEMLVPLVALVAGTAGSARLLMD
jgi:hypothetical protein